MIISSSEVEVLFKQHYQMLCNAAYRITHDVDAAEDIVQDVFIRILNKLDSIKLEHSLKGYLIRSVTNASLNYLEANKKVVSINLNYSTSVTTLDGYEKLDGKDLEKIIEKAIGQLPPQCKAVFILSRFENMKYKEIAEHLDISIKTVENHLGKALNILRENLKPYLTKQFLARSYHRN